jgi:hypothetical protein
MSVSKKTTKKPQYEASVRVLGKMYHAKGKTAQEAIYKLEPGSVAGAALLTVKKGRKSKEHILPTVQARRLFNASHTAREILAKNVGLIFEGI